MQIFVPVIDRPFNTLRLQQNGNNFAGNVFSAIYWMKNFGFEIQFEGDMFLIIDKMYISTWNIKCTIMNVTWVARTTCRRMISSGSIGALGTNFSKIWIKIQKFSLIKMLLKRSSVKWQPFFFQGEMSEIAEVGCMRLIWCPIIWTLMTICPWWITNTFYWMCIIILINLDICFDQLCYFHIKNMGL